MSRGECREVGIDGWVILGVGCVVDIVVVASSSVVWYQGSCDVGHVRESQVTWWIVR